MEGVIPVKVASVGVGVDSVAGLLIEGLDKYDEIIFADTGSEKKETYSYLEYLTKTLGWKIKVVRSKYGNIFTYYWNKRIYPNMFARDCTGKFKIDPINKYLRTMYGKKAHFEVDIFIDYSEFHRMRESKYKYSTLKYPLIDKKLTREDCKRIIQEHKMPVPIKSGCYFCPFTPPKVWRAMKQSPEGTNEKEYYLESRKLEKNSQMRNKRQFPLVRLKGKDSQDLFECGCFNYNTDAEQGENEMKRLGDLYENPTWSQRGF